jgi:predicted acetyltransferase
MTDCPSIDPADAKLVMPTMALAPWYLDALREGHHRGAERGERHTAEEIAAIEADLPAHLAALNDQNGTYRYPDGRVVPLAPFAEFWLAVDLSFIGRVQVRYELDADLGAAGGHIGYGIRPSRRRQGFATVALKLGLAHARNRGMSRVLVTCADANIGSRLVIERNGGALETVGPHPVRAGVIQRRYWIELNPDA